MPIRRPEFYEEGVYHIYNRGVAKLPVFLGDTDYRDFQDILRYLLIGFPIKISHQDRFLSKEVEKEHLPVTYKADPQSNGLFKNLIDLVAYCLMPNHFHLLIQIKNPIGQLQREDRRMRSFYSIPEFMRRLAITYTQKFNYRNQREGSVFQGVYKVKNVPNDSYVIQVGKYIHLNPVTAGLVDQPDKWFWSDYPAYERPEAFEHDQFTTQELLMSYFGGKKQDYVEFIKDSLFEETKDLAKYTIDHEN